MKKLGEKGYTLLELMLVTAIVALITNSTMIAIFQILRNTERNENQITAVGQVENAGYWIGLDTQRAQSVEAEGIGSGTNIIISWEQSESGDLENSGQYTVTLYFAFSGDDGESWGDNIEAFTGNNPPDYFSYTIPAEYLTSTFKMRFYLLGPDGWIGGDEYAYLDNINVSEAVFIEECANYDDWDNGNDWSISSERFTGRHYGGSDSERYLTMDTSQDLSPYESETLLISWSQDSDGSLESSDGLYFAFSGDGGQSWSSNIEAFHGYPPSSFSYTIPAQYITDDFRIQFYLDNFGGNGEFLYLDNITISKAIFSDDCTSYANWDDGNDWDTYSGEFRGHHYGGSDTERYLTMSNSLDLVTVIPAAGFPLILTWANWSETGGIENVVTYTITDNQLIRSHSVDGEAATETYVAQYIDSNNTNCQFANGKLTLQVTASVGAGPATKSETRHFQVITRPD